MTSRIAGAVALFVAGSFACAATLTAQTGAPATKRVPVVVELFTSEGCSDCPPADVLLTNLETRQPVPGVEVIALEEHVDYWNHDGWIDPFSSASWTFRQQEYAAKLKGATEYTPQMIVDGETQFVGSNAANALIAILNAAHQPHVDMSISPGKTEGKDAQDFSVSVGSLGAMPPGDAADLWLAVTEDGLHSSVGAGENAGHKLYHTAVLRSLNKIGIAKPSGASQSFTAEPRVKFSSHWKRDQLRVIVLAQDKRSLRILGAATIAPSTEVVTAKK
jgi:hypothetical protein